MSLHRPKGPVGISRKGTCLCRGLDACIFDFPELQEIKVDQLLRLVGAELCPSVRTHDPDVVGNFVQQEFTKVLELVPLASSLAFTSLFENTAICKAFFSHRLGRSNAHEDPIATA